jgi:site-specific recombinase XerC
MLAKKAANSRDLSPRSTISRRGPQGTIARTDTLRDALALALEHWDGRSGARVMAIMATRCVDLVGGQVELQHLQVRHGVRLLAALRAEGLSPKSIQTYYATFRRVLTLSEFQTPTWPKAPKPPRKTRDPLSPEDLQNIIAWLDHKGWQATGDVGRLLRATGLRIDVEALTVGKLRVTLGDDYDELHVTGKGGHERIVPVVRADARELLRSDARLNTMRAISYSGHIKRWKKGVSTMGVTSRLATPHAIRHGYASEVHHNSGGNLALVQDLLGHADPGTTAGYLSVDLQAKAKAVSRP